MKLQISLKAQNLNNVAGLFKGTSDPFAVVTLAGNKAGDVPRIIGKTEVIQNNLSPDWTTTFMVDYELGEPANLLVKIFDEVRKSDNIPMGSAVFEVGAVLGAKGNTRAKKVDKGKGKVFVKVEPVAEDERPAAAVPELKEVLTNIQLEEAPTTPSKTKVEAPPSRSKANFTDYIAGGCELSFNVAIDFTGSNGDPRDSGTLHYLHQDGSKNDYEKAISAIGGILEKYDSDKKFPVWGFGAKFDGVLDHCFQCGPTEEVNGVEGILNAYHETFRSGLTMSGPTVITEVIEIAAIRAMAAQEEATKKGMQKYSILLILTDGAVSDVAATAKCIDGIDEAPLSIIIVGIGGADFSGMQFLDDHSGDIDIAQFVEFNKHRHHHTSLTNATLDEVPKQVEAYFSRNGIMPNPPVEMEDEEITIERIDEDIDLTVGFGPANNEMRVTGAYVPEGAY